MTEKAPYKLEFDECLFSDIGIMDVEEKEVTYIRKDELVAWAEKHLADAIEEYREGFGFCYSAEIDAYKKLVEKLKSL